MFMEKHGYVFGKYNFLCGGPKKGPAHPEKNPGDGPGNGLYMLLYKLYLGLREKNWT